MQGRRRDTAGLSPSADAAMSRNARSMVCLTCRGRKKIKVKSPTETETRRKVWVDCDVCRGTGSRSEGAASQSASRGVPKQVTAEQVAEAIAMMPRAHFLAAVLETTGNTSVIDELEELVASEIVTPAAERWNIGAEARKIRILGAARVVTTSLVLPPMERPKTSDARILMCCSAHDWRRTWRPKVEPLIKVVRGWSKDAGKHINECLDDAA